MTTLLLRRCCSPAGVFCAAVVITLLFWALLPASLNVDDGSDYSAFYGPVARNLAAGHGLLMPDGNVAGRYPPGYPLVLAGDFAVATALRLPENLVQTVVVLLCLGAATALLWSIARLAWGRWSATAVALLWAGYPFMLWLTKQPNSEIPFVAVLYAGLALAGHAARRDRDRWAGWLLFGAGLLLGCAMLIRPIAVGVGVLVAGLIVLGLPATTRRVRWGLALALLLGNLVAVAPWEGWLLAQTGSLAPLSTGGVASMRDGLTFAVNPKGYRQTIPVPLDVADLMRTIRSRATLDSVGRIAGFLAHEATVHPGTVGRLFALKAARSWYATDSGRSEGLILALQGLYLLPVAAASVALGRRGRVERQLLGAVWLLVGYFWLMTILALSVLRYMVPAMGLLFLLLPALLPTRPRHLAQATL